MSEVPAAMQRITTGCQYCAVGCRYTALLVPEGANPDEKRMEPGISRFITKAITNEVNYKVKKQRIAVTPEPFCDLNKRNHSGRGAAKAKTL